MLIGLKYVIEGGMAYMQEFDNHYNNNNTQKEDKSLKIGSFFFGIFSIICSFSISIFMLPFSIVGLILGVLYKKK